MLVELRLENGEIHTRRLARSLRRCGQRNSRVLLRTNGLSEPILLYEGTILDGRNRYRACLEAAIDPIFETYSGSNPLAKVISLNLKRRHLDEWSRRGSQPYQGALTSMLQLKHARNPTPHNY
jgi:hypothetical protein